MVILKHYINTLIAHVKYSGPKDLAPDSMEHLQVVFRILSPKDYYLRNYRQSKWSKKAELFFLWGTFNVLDDMLFDFVDHLEKFRVKLLQNYHTHPDMYLIFLPMVIGSYLNPNYRLGFI